jgi:hypothetical protein
MSDDSKKGWVAKLQDRWGVTANQVFIILIVFACTGTTVMFLKKPIVAFFVGDGDKSIIFSVIYYILILPVYNIILLIYGFIFGQFDFFWKFEKRMLSRMIGKKN